MGSTLSRASGWAFGATGLADNVIGTFLGVHLFVFYTDVIGASPLAVSAAMTIAMVWNAFFDPTVGRISDRASFRSGRRRPFLLIGAPLLGVSFIALLHPPAALDGLLDGWGLGVWLTGALVLLFTAKSLVQVPALALLPELAEGGHARVALASKREQLGNLGDLLGLLLPVALLIVRGGGETSDPAITRGAFGDAAFVIAGLATLGVLVAWAGTRERLSDRPTTARRPPLGLRALVTLLAEQRAFRAVLLAAALGALALSFVQSMILYVLEHVMREHDPVVHLGAFVLNACAAITSYPLWSRFAGAIGRPNAFRASLALSCLAFFAVFLVGPGDHLALAAVMVFSGAANVGFWTLLHTLNADCADRDAQITGERREGLFMGLSALVKKLAITGAAAGVGVGLSVIGYQEGAAPTAEVVDRLRLLFALPTTVVMLAALWSFRGFDVPVADATRAPAAVSTRATLP